MVMIVHAPSTVGRRWHRMRYVAVSTLRSVVQLQDTPYRIAMGAASGIACAFLPTIGQMFLGMALARVLRANVLASLPWTWITNPVTTLPIWWGCYLLGSAVLASEHLSFAEIERIVEQFSSLSGREVFSQGWSILGRIFWPTLLGSVLIGGAAAAISYPLIRWMVLRAQARRLRRRHAWLSRTSSDTLR